MYLLQNYNQWFCEYVSVSTSNMSVNVVNSVAAYINMQY